MISFSTPWYANTQWCLLQCSRLRISKLVKNVSVTSTFFSTHVNLSFEFICGVKFLVYKNLSTPDVTVTPRAYNINAIPLLQHRPNNYGTFQHSQRSCFVVSSENNLASSPTRTCPRSTSVATENYLTPDYNNVPTGTLWMVCQRHVLS